MRWEHLAAQDRTPLFYRSLERPGRRGHLVKAPNGRIRRVLAIFPPVILPPTTPVPAPHSYSACFAPKVSAVRSRVGTLLPRLQTETTTTKAGALSWAQPLVTGIVDRGNVTSTIDLDGQRRGARAGRGLCPGPPRLPPRPAPALRRARRRRVGDRLQANLPPAGRPTLGLEVRRPTRPFASVFGEAGGWGVWGEGSRLQSSLRWCRSRPCTRPAGRRSDERAPPLHVAKKGEGGNQAPVGASRALARWDSERPGLRLLKDERAAP